MMLHIQLFCSLDSLPLVYFQSRWNKCMCNILFRDTCVDLRDKSCLRIHIWPIFRFRLCLKLNFFNLKPKRIKGKRILPQTVFEAQHFLCSYCKMQSSPGRLKNSAQSTVAHIKSASRPEYPLNFKG